MSSAPDQVSKATAKASFGAYDSSNKTLRAWLATYSVGVPAFLFSKDSVLAQLAAHNATQSVALLFGIAVALQVALTFLNKYTQWGVYARYSEPPERGVVTEWAERVSEWIWIDLVIDVATIALLAWGSVEAFMALTAR